MVCKIAQWNLGRGKVATEEAVRRCLEERVDILLIQEPYSVGRKLKISGGRAFYDMSGRDDVWSAVLVLNDEIDVLMDNRETSGSCVSVKMEYRGSCMQVVSLYCRPSEPIDGYLALLMNIIRKRDGKGVLCGGEWASFPKYGKRVWSRFF